MTAEQGILYTLLHFSSFGFMLSGVLVWLRRSFNTRARIFLAVSLFLSGFAFFIRIVAAHFGPAETSGVLPIANLHAGLLAVILLYLYPVEVINPGWLTLRRGILLFMPWLVLTLLLLLLPFQFRHLSSFNDIWQHAAEFNVWFRLLILFSCIVPYSFFLFYIPYNRFRSRADYRWIWVYTVGIQGIGILYTLFMLTRSLWVSILHVTYALLFCLFVTYQELFLRFSVPAEATETEKLPLSLLAASRELMKGKNPTHPLWVQLERVMDEQKLWKNPDLTIEHLAKAMKTNRTTLAALLQEEGFEGYKEFINGHRINEFLKIVDSDRFINIQDAFYAVGFRSRTTAIRYFRKCTGMTPTEYLKELYEEE